MSGLPTLPITAQRNHICIIKVCHRNNLLYELFNYNISSII